MWTYSFMCVMYKRCYGVCVWDVIIRVFVCVCMITWLAGMLQVVDGGTGSGPVSSRGSTPSFTPLALLAQPTRFRPNEDTFQVQNNIVYTILRAVWIAREFYYCCVTRLNKLIRIRFKVMFNLACRYISYY